MSTSVDKQSPDGEVIAQTVAVETVPGAPADIPPPEVPEPPSKDEMAARMREKFAANRAERESREGAVTDAIRGLTPRTEQAPGPVPPSLVEEYNPFEAPPADARIPQPSEQLLGKMNPAPIPIPEPRGPKGAGPRAAVPAAKSPAASPSAKRLGEIGKKLPGSEHIKVRKRDPRSGQMQHIGDYSIRDIPQAMDFESFLSAYVRPTHGGGDYYLSGVDSQGREMDAGIIRLADTQQPEEPQGGGMMDIMKMMMQREQDANQRMMAMMQNPRGADPITQMHQVMGLKKELEADVPSAEGPMSAMVQAMNAQAQQSMQMFMAMQQQAQQQQQQMVTMLAAGRNETDPMLAMLMAKAEESSKAASIPMPPPLPPPPLGGIDLNALLPTLLTTLPAIMEMLRREDPSVALLKEMVVAKQGDGLTTRDAIELLTNKTGTDDFKAAAENMNMMLNIQGMMQERMGGGGGGFFDSIGSALGALFSNGNFAGSLADNIQASAEQKRKGPGEPSAEARQLMAARKQLVAEQGQLARERAALAEERKRLAAPVETAAPAGAVAEVVQGVAVDQSGEHVIPADQTEAVDRVKERTGGALPEFPPELPDMLNSWLEGIEVTVGEDGEMGIGEVNDAKLAEGVVNTFVFLFQVPTWQPLIGRLFQAVQKADREESLSMIGAFVEAFQSIGALDPKVGEQAMRVMSEHFDAVVTTLRGFFGEAEKAAEAQSDAQAEHDELTDVSGLYEGLEDDDDDDDDDEDDEGDEGGGRAA